MNMIKYSLLIFFLFGQVAAAAQPASPALPDNLAISRLDCGTIRVNRGAWFSDTMTYAGQSFPLVESCYLIRHGEEYLLWDTGLRLEYLGASLNDTDPISDTLKASVLTQLADGRLDPARITRIGISHYHPDHTGQLKDFPHATLLIGKGDWDVIAAEPTPKGHIFRRGDFDHWISGGGDVSSVSGDLDIFGDGSVIMLSTRGHTPGHSSLLVRLRDKGNVILSGDAVHRIRNYEEELSPVFNVDRADTLASIDRLKKLVETLDATFIIQHEPKHVGKVSAFPEWTD